MREALRYWPVLVGIVAQPAILFVVASFASDVMERYPDISGLTFVAAIAAWLILFALVIVALERCFHPPRPKPPGFIGRFARSDGSIVLAARLANGRVWAVREATATLPAAELGEVHGRVLATWTRLPTTPVDRNQRLPRAE